MNGASIAWRSDPICSAALFSCANGVGSELRGVAASIPTPIRELPSTHSPASRSRSTEAATKIAVYEQDRQEVA